MAHRHFLGGTQYTFKISIFGTPLAQVVILYFLITAVVVAYYTVEIAY